MPLGDNKVEGGGGEVVHTPGVKRSNSVGGKPDCDVTEARRDKRDDQKRADVSLPSRSERGPPIKPPLTFRAPPPHPS